MKNLLALLFFLIFSSSAFAAKEIIQDKTVIWDSKKGLERLSRSQYKTDFYQLINFYQPQLNPIHCSIASAVIVLNALKYGDIPSQKELEVSRPESVGGGVAKYPIYSQKTFLNSATDKIKRREVINFEEKIMLNGKEIYDAGLSLDDLGEMLSGPYDVKVKTVHAVKNNEKSVAEFRDAVKRAMKDDKNFIIVNFDGKLLGKTTTGHISPLAAYDEESDSVLILDTALHKNKWYFADVATLFKAMNTKDTDDYRGYLIIRR